MNGKLEKWLFKSFQTISSNNVAGKATILTFHKVSNTTTPFALEEIGVDDFRRKMKVLKNSFNVMPLPELLAAAQNDELPPYSVAITIDDGYEDCYSTIAPILDELGLSGTFFIATSGIKNGGLWNDKIAYTLMNTSKMKVDVHDQKNINISSVDSKVELYNQFINQSKYMTLDERESFIDDLLLTFDVSFEESSFLTKKNILEMSNAGMIIGAHTDRHPILCVESDEVAYQEIIQSKEMLEQITGKPVKYFAYPNGLAGKDFELRHEKMVQEIGFEAAFSTNWGHLTQSTNRFAIPRFTPWDRNEYRFSSRLVNHFRKTFR